MFQQNRREMKIIAVIIAAAACIGAIVAVNTEPLNVHYPDQFAVLTDQDFQLIWKDHTLNIGSTPGEAIMEFYPYGYMLGISTIFSLNKDDILFTFTEDENILHKAHIENPALPTARGVHVGDSFQTVIDSYGNQYGWVDNGQADDFDAVYGDDNSRCIVFQVREGVIKRIVLQNDPPKG